MNGSKAKNLRRIARERTEGKPDRRLMVKQRAVTVGYDPDGKPQQVGKVQVVNHPDTTRGVYLALKKVV